MVPGRSLALAPVLVGLTHAPAAAMAAEKAAWHRHSHSDASSLTAVSHDAADHEHQTTALPVRDAGPEAMPAARLLPAAAALPSGLARAGPRRPPRPV